MKLPERTADTMSEAIAMSSPSGCMSKRAKAAAEKRFRKMLFGPEGLPWPGSPDRLKHKQDSRCVVLLRRAWELRELAARGMCTRKYTKEAARLEAKAAKLQGRGAEK